MQGISACADIVARGDPDRFLSAMTASVEQRKRLLPLYAFNIEVARVPWRTNEPMVAQMRLVWWRDQIEALGKGGPAKGHEVLEPLAALIKDANLPVSVLLAMIEARHWDIERVGFADIDALLAYLGATAGGLMWLSALALGAPKEMEPVARKIGLAHGIAAWLMAVPALKAAGRHPLPGKADEMVRVLVRTGLRALNEARATRFKAATPALRAAWRAPSLLKQAARDPSSVRDGRLGQSEFMRRSGLLWKTFVGAAW